MSTQLLQVLPRASWLRGLAVRVLALPPAYAGLTLLMGVAALLRPQLLSPMLLALILRQAAPLGIAAIGQSLAMRCLSLDLSFGGVVVGAAYILTSGALPWELPALMAASLTFGLAVGAFNGAMVAGLRASSVIVTLGVALVTSGVVLALTQLRAPGDAPEALREWGRARALGVPLPALVWVALLLPCSLALRASVFGRVMAAWGANPQAAMASGLPVRTLLFTAHVLASGFAVISGWMLVAFVGVGSVNLGQDLALNALAASILGGVHFGSARGGLLGPAVAAFMLTFLFNFLTSLGLGEPGRLMLQGLLVAAAAVTYSLRRAQRY